MSTIKNPLMKGKKLMIYRDMVEFNSEGFAEVTKEQAEILSGLSNYSIEDENDTLQDEVLTTLYKSLNDEEKLQGEEPEPLGEDDVEKSEVVEDKTETECEHAECEKFTFEELDTKTVPALKKIAKDTGIDLNGASKKDEIIPIILGRLI